MYPIQKIVDNFSIKITQRNKYSLYLPTDIKDESSFSTQVTQDTTPNANR